MAAEIRATGLSTEQATAVLDELSARGFAGASTSSNAGDASRVDVRIGLDGQTDVRSLATWLDEQRIDHVIEQEHRDGDGNLVVTKQEGQA